MEQLSEVGIAVNINDWLEKEFTIFNYEDPIVDAIDSAKAMLVEYYRDHEETAPAEFSIMLQGPKGHEELEFMDFVLEYNPEDYSFETIKLDKYKDKPLECNETAFLKYLKVRFRGKI
jgi:hypothetical protein